MDYREIVERLAPCGLDCGRCAVLNGGEIGRLSARLKELLGGYGRLARMRAGDVSALAGFPQFEGVLEELAKPACSGCRGRDARCPLSSCRARTCAREKGIDFCFECAEYPCPEQFAGMEKLRAGWMAKNDRMRDVGVERFYEEQLTTPRYPV